MIAACLLMSTKWPTKVVGSMFCWMSDRIIYIMLKKLQISHEVRMVSQNQSHFVRNKTRPSAGLSPPGNISEMLTGQLNLKHIPLMFELSKTHFWNQHSQTRKIEKEKRRRKNIIYETIGKHSNRLLVYCHCLLWKRKWINCSARVRARPHTWAIEDKKCRHLEDDQFNHSALW